jgi:hypothetical protein
MEKIKLGLVIYNKKETNKLHFQVAEVYKNTRAKMKREKLPRILNIRSKKLHKVMC